MAIIPTAYSMSQQPSLRSGRKIATYDTTAIGRGMQQFAAGVGDLAQGVASKLNSDNQQQNAVDLARSEANLTKGLMDVENTYQNDPDYATLSTRGSQDIDKQLAASAALIRDPKMKERWLATKEEAAVRAKDWLTDKATTKQRDASVVAVDDANKTLYDLVIDPDTPDDVREKARADIAGAIDVNEKTGLLSPEEAAKRRELFVDGSYDQQALLAVERGKLNLPTPDNPLYAGDVVIDPLTRAMINVESKGKSDAESHKGASGWMQVMPKTGAEIARELGDGDYPVTEAEQKEYLKNPAVSVRYGQHYMKKMLAKYDGDQDAALIAYNGGPDRADKWLAAGRDDKVLPTETAEYYKKVKAGIADAPKIDVAQVADARKFLQSRTDKDAGHIEGMKDQFAVKLSKMIQDAPPEIQKGLGVFSGARSEERQTELYNAALKKYGSPAEARKWVAPPGKSRHNHGDAADLSYNGQSLAKAPPEVVKWVHDNAEKYGLSFPLGNENWHVEDADARLNKPAKDVPAYWDKVSPQMREKLYQASAANKDALLKQQIAENKVFQQQARDDYSLQIAVNPNRVSQNDILGDNRLDNGDKAALINTLTAARKENEGVNEFITALGGGDTVAINPFDPDQKKLADKAFDQMLGATTEDKRGLLASSFISQTGYIPDKVRSEIRRNMATTDVPTMATSLQTVDAIQKLAPTSILAMEGHEQIEKNLTAYRHYAFDLGYSQEEAARKVVALNDPAMIAQRDAIMKSKPIADAIKAVDANAVADLYDGVFSSQPALGDAPTQQEVSVGYNPESEAVILAEYKSMLEEGVADAGGDLELGKKMANERFTRLYAPSPMTLAGDSAISKLPPERTYPADNNGSHEYIRQQALDDLKAEGINASEVFLQAYDQTERDVAAGKPANYQVFYIQDGQLQKLPNPFTADPALANKTAVETSRVKQKENLKSTIETGERLDAAGKRKEGSEDWIKAQEIQNEYQRIQSEKRTGKPIVEEVAPETPDTGEMPATDAMGNPI